jgi:hypothetical protein
MHKNIIEELRSEFLIFKHKNIRDNAMNVIRIEKYIDYVRQMNELQMEMNFIHDFTNLPKTWK